MAEDKLFKVEAVKVPKKWKERAFIDKDEYEKLYAKSVEKPDKFWGKAGQAARLDQALYARQEHLLRLSRHLDQMVRGRHAQCQRQLHRPASEEARQQAAIIWEPDDPRRRRRAHHLSRAAQRGDAVFANVLKSIGVDSAATASPSICR